MDCGKTYVAQGKACDKHICVCLVTVYSLQNVATTLRVEYAGGKEHFEYKCLLTLRFKIQTKLFTLLKS